MDSDSNAVLKEIEHTIATHIPEQWDASHLDSLLGKTAYVRDVEALNKTAALPINDFIMRGGKRIRPRLLLSLLEVFGLDHRKYFDFAYLVESIHNGTLVVDDVEDDSELRRGKPTSHKLFGVDVGINSGVLMHFLPLSVLTKNKHALPESQLNRIWSMYGEEMINVYLGQATDISWHKGEAVEVSEEKYFEMCRLKTGSLMRLSVRIPCALANKDKDTEEKFTYFAEHIGIAFQIKDDLLDLTAEREAFGKSYGNDITEGKYSLPVVYSLETLDGEKKERLITILSSHTRDVKTIDEALQIIHESGALTRAEEKADAVLKDAWQKVRPLIENEETFPVFETFVNTFVSRKS